MTSPTPDPPPPPPPHFRADANKLTVFTFSRLLHPPPPPGQVNKPASFFFFSPHTSPMTHLFVLHQSAESCGSRCVSSCTDTHVSFPHPHPYPLDPSSILFSDGAIKPKLSNGFGHHNPFSSQTPLFRRGGKTTTG